MFNFPAIYAFLVYKYIVQTSLSVGIERKPWNDGYTIVWYKTSSIDVVTYYVITLVGSVKIWAPYNKESSR